VKDVYGEVIINVIAGIVTLLAFVFCGFAFGYDRGYEKGYTEALDDARLGKPARYKLVQISEKWVEVGR
jgi:hypothetical protein